MSTFHGLEMARQALFAQQSALYTTGHNISNANTDGYSRQRVNFGTMPAYPAPGRNQPHYPGQIGTGVKIDAVQRIRDQFLDIQFRAENSRSGYWNAKAAALSRMEELLNEPSDSGLSKTLDQFWQSLQDLAVNPENSGARAVVAQRGLAVAETFNYLSHSLHSIQNDLKNQINNTVETANSLLRQIHNINYQIRKIEPHGKLANDLYDDRDRLIDELSKIMNIKVTKSKSSESAPDIADGVVTIELVDLDGNPFDPTIKLLDGHGDYKEEYFNDLIQVEYDVKPEGAVESEKYYDLVSNIKIKNTKIADNGDFVYDTINFNDFLTIHGSLSGLIQSFGYVKSEDDVKTPFGIYPEVIAELDELAYHFAVEFNKIHEKGYDLDGVEGKFFFGINNYVADDSSGAAANIYVNEEILKNPNLIAASINGTSGNGDNALNLAKFLSGDLEGIKNEDNQKIDIKLLDGKTVKGYYESMIGSLGVKAQEANRMSTNTEVLLAQVDHQRMSVSAVSLDEEMSNMIKFQHAYNAAARSLTVIDEMLDRIINGMGLVGR